MLEEEAAKLALADAETVGEFFYGCGGAVEGALSDESEGTRDGVRGSTPGGEIGCGFGAATEAGAEAGLLRGGGGTEETGVFELRAASRADRAAVNSG